MKDLINFIIAAAFLLFAFAGCDGCDLCDDVICENGGNCINGV